MNTLFMCLGEMGPIASSVHKFAECASPIPNYASQLINENVFGGSH